MLYTFCFVTQEKDSLSYLILLSYLDLFEHKKKTFHLLQQKIFWVHTSPILLYLWTQTHTNSLIKQPTKLLHPTLLIYIKFSKYDPTNL